MDDFLQQKSASWRKLIATAESAGLHETPTISQLVKKVAKITGIYPVPNIAVDVCMQAYVECMQEHLEKKTNPEDTFRAVRLAYCFVLPRLTDSDSIRDFIACVVHGMAINLIPSQEGTRLLYGAQVGYSALATPNTNKKRVKNTQNTPGNQPINQSPSTT